MNQLMKSPHLFFVPELFFVEMFSLFCRVFKNVEQVQTATTSLEQLGIQRIGTGSDILTKAGVLAINHGLSGYDAIYAATAELCKGIWITADNKAHEKIASLGMSELL